MLRAQAVSRKRKELDVFFALDYNISQKYIMIYHAYHALFRPYITIYHESQNTIKAVSRKRKELDVFFALDCTLRLR